MAKSNGQFSVCISLNLLGALSMVVQYYSSSFIPFLNVASRNHPLALPLTCWLLLLRLFAGYLLFHPSAAASSPRTASFFLLRPHSSLTGTRKALSLDFHTTTITSFKSLFRLHLLHEAFHDHPAENYNPQGPLVSLIPLTLLYLCL